MSYPIYFLEMPFAQNGNYTIPPVNQAEEGNGRTSLSTGFPPETQRPIPQGGIAPNRWDFNGILYQLSAFAYWQQSGGMWVYQPRLEYAPPAIVWYGNEYWACIKANGKSSVVVTPGTDTTYWVSLLSYLQSIDSTDSIPKPSETLPLIAGTAAVGAETAYARGDHRHPAQTSVSGSSGSCTGNAATATKLQTVRSITLTGDVTGSGSFDGSANCVIATQNAVSAFPTIQQGSIPPDSASFTLSGDPSTRWFYFVWRQYSTAYSATDTGYAAGGSSIDLSPYIPNAYGTFFAIQVG